MNDMSYVLDDEKKTIFFGQLLARCLFPGVLLGLRGDLGYGKTCLIRSCLQELGVTSAIKSPSFNLVESYELENLRVYHFDLYRMSDVYELEDLGFRDYLNADSICFIEWPERAPLVMTLIDVMIELELDLPGRIIRMQGQSEKGKLICELFREHYE